MTGIIFIFFACLLWAADTLIRYPLLFGGSSAQQIVLFEHLILVAMIVGVFVFQRRKFNFISRNTIIPFVVIGIFGSALGTLAFTEAFYLSNPTVVILLQKLQPLIAVTLAYVLLKEKITPRFFLWLGSGSLNILTPYLITSTRPFSKLLILLMYCAASFAWYLVLFHSFFHSCFK